MIRLFNHYLSVRVLLLTALEILVLFQAVLLGIERAGLGGTTGSRPFAETAMLTAAMLASMAAIGLYRTNPQLQRGTLQRVLVAHGVAVIGMYAVLPLFPEMHIPHEALALGSLFGVAGLLLLRTVFFRLTDLGWPKRRLLVVGNGEEAEAVIEYLHSESLRRSVEFAGLCPVMTERSEGGQTRMLDHGAIHRTVVELKVSEIVVAVRERRGGMLPLRQLLDCRLRGIKVMDLQSFYEREQGIRTLDSLRASWMIFGDGFRQGIARNVAKRVFDIVVSTALIVLTLPLLVLAAIAIVVEPGFPILYRQERVGQGGRRFNIIKLRSMRRAAEADGAPRWGGIGDSRGTRVGAVIRKCRIDELPQLLNVLRVDMSFVGPRPERPYIVEKLSEQVPFCNVRHSMKPGVTGWAQVRFGDSASISHRTMQLQYDLYYVKNHSMFLDLMLLVETIQVVLLGKGSRRSARPRAPGPAPGVDAGPRRSTARQPLTGIHRDAGAGTAATPGSSVPSPRDARVRGRATSTLRPLRPCPTTPDR
jgi:sugar transferase (PEP-CTERM system associated)